MRREPEIVIFDTNTVRSESSEHFLGGRAELENFQKVATIVLPEMVVEEVRAQKHKHFTSKRDAFFGNVFHKLFGLDEDKTKQFDVRAHIQDIEEAETISYKAIPLTDRSIFREIERMALENIPPFSSESDKGFKDVVIYFTVLEYLKQNPEIPYVFFVTNDDRFAKAFENNPRIKVISDFSEFQKYRLEYFSEEYFLGSLATELGVIVGDIEINDAWLNINGNWVVLAKIQGKDVIRAEVDFNSREILGTCKKDLKGRVAMFKTDTGSFAGVHSVISVLSSYVGYLSDDEILVILQEAVDNRQIYWISTDDDVREFLLPLFESKGALLSDEVSENFRKKYL